MRSLSVALQEHLAGECTSLATCWKVTFSDGTVAGFTDHDIDLLIDDVRYLAATGFTASNVDTKAALNVDNLDLQGMLSSPTITEGELVAGRWDHAAIEVFQVNWQALDDGRLNQRKGRLGEVNIAGSVFKAEMRGMMQALQQPLGEVYSASCKADLYDARCTVPETEGVYKFSAQTVGAILSAQRRWTDAALTQPAGFFTAGKVLWTAGDNAGLSKEVKTHATGGDITLEEAMPYAVAVGDEYTIWAGCLKRFTEDCGTKFDNQINFRGFPHIPGNDMMLKGPDR
jgi:uncharacterized phage protein (TIGR02218 family)